jgi:hypothetical protein
VMGHASEQIAVPFQSGHGIVNVYRALFMDA